MWETSHYADDIVRNSVDGESRKIPEEDLNHNIRQRSQTSPRPVISASPPGVPMDPNIEKLNTEINLLKSRITTLENEIKQKERLLEITEKERSDALLQLKELREKSDDKIRDAVTQFQQTTENSTQKLLGNLSSDRSQLLATLRQQIDFLSNSREGLYKQINDLQTQAEAKELEFNQLRSDLNGAQIKLRDQERDYEKQNWNISELRTQLDQKEKELEDMRGLWSRGQNVLNETEEKWTVEKKQVDSVVAEVTRSRDHYKSEAESLLEKLRQQEAEVRKLRDLKDKMERDINSTVKTSELKIEETKSQLLNQVSQLSLKQNQLIGERDSLRIQVEDKTRLLLEMQEEAERVKTRIRWLEEDRNHVLLQFEVYKKNCDEEKKLLEEDNARLAKELQGMIDMYESVPGSIEKVWEDDSVITMCPICTKDFTTLRRRVSLS
jgi:chromosome segregation ATPase